MRNPASRPREPPDDSLSSPFPPHAAHVWIRSSRLRSIGFARKLTLRALRLEYDLVVGERSCGVVVVVWSARLDSYRRSGLVELKSHRTQTFDTRNCQ